MSRPANQEPRGLPYAAEAERAVLAAALFHGGEALERARSEMSAEDLHVPAHRVVWRAMESLESRGEAIDVVTLEQELARVNALSVAGGLEGLSKLADGHGVLATVPQHARIVAEKSKQRRLVLFARELGEAARSPEDLGRLLSTAQADLAEIGAGYGAVEYVSAKELMMRTMQDVMARKRGEVVTMPTGFADLDKASCGLAGKTVVVIGGRPKMGKTALAFSVVRAVVEAQYPALVFELEMPETQVGRRLVQAEGRLRTEQMLNPLECDFQRVISTMDKLSGRPLDVFSGRASLSKIQRLARRWRHDKSKCPDKSKPALIVVDYLQLVDSTGLSAQNREQVISTISRELKLLAMELNVCILLLSQLNRGVEQRPDKRPLMSDLRESGAIEQDADAIWLLYRDWVYDKETPPTEAELNIPAQREGASGVRVPLRFEGEFARFINLKEHEHAVRRY